MKSQRAIAYFALAVVAGIGTIGLRATWAQDRKTGEVRVVVPDASEIRRSVEHELAAVGISAGNSMESKIRKAAEKLRDAKDDEAKTAARKELGGLLSQYFDQDMDRRTKELLDLKERLNKLTAQLELRREKKQDIIDLQIQVAVNEAEGLGFMTRPNGPFTGEFNFPYGGPAVYFSHDGDMSVAVPPTPPTPHPHPGGEAEETTE